MVDKSVRQQSSGIRRLRERPTPAATRETAAGSKRPAADDVDGQPSPKRIVADVRGPATPGSSAYADSVFDGLTETDFKRLEDQANGLEGRQERPSSGASNGAGRQAADDLEIQPSAGKAATDTGRATTAGSDEYADSVFDGLTEADFKRLENQADGHERHLERPSSGASNGAGRQAANDLENQPSAENAATNTGRATTPGSDEYADSVFDGLTEADFEELERQATQFWFEDDTKLYLLEGSRRIGDADSWMQESYNRPPHSANVLNISDDGVLKLTPAGKEQLEDVQIMVWNGDSAYKLYRAHEIKGGNLKAFYEAKLPEGHHSTSRTVGNISQPNVYLRDQKDQFRSIENYNQRYGNRDAAQARFAEISGRTTRQNIHHGAQSGGAAVVARNLDSRPRGQDRLR